MSVRPRAGAPNPRRGGDGVRRRWSESKIPKVGTRRVRSAGVPTPTYFLIDISDPPDGTVWTTPGSPAFPYPNGYFRITYISTEASASPDWWYPGGDTNDLPMAAAGPYTGGTPYATVSVTAAVAGLEIYLAGGTPAASVEWVPTP